MQHHGAGLRALEKGDRDLAEALASDWRSADVGFGLRALLAYGEKLTREPEAMEEADLRRLRDAGWSDEAILHACEVVAYFNFVNRTADGLGVTLEEDWPHRILSGDGEDDG